MKDVILAESKIILKDSTILDTLTIDEFRNLYEYQQNKSPISTPYGDIKLSKTAKVVIQGKYICVGCDSKVSHVSIHTNTHKVYVTFWTIRNGRPQILTKDHIIPRVLGGKDHRTNLQSMCFQCNQEKAHTVTDEDLLASGHFDKEIGHTTEVDIAEAEENAKKIKDFYYTRKRIKKAIKNIPWYWRILGVGRYIEKEIKKPLLDRGYYSNSENS